MIRRRKMRLYKGEFFDILKAIFSGKVSNGKHVEIFERKFSNYIGTNYAIATCSGRIGMELILKSLGLKENDEIIMSAYTLKDLVYLLQDLKYTPVLVDIEEDTFHIDPNQIEKVISDRTKVIIATHMFGSPCMIKNILSIANKYNLIVIEDCAQAAGAEYNGKKVGSFGKAAFFSFETIKPINTFGGGMVTTNDNRIARSIKNSLRSYTHAGNKVIFKIYYTYVEHFILHSPMYYVFTSLFRSKFFTKLISKIYLSVHDKCRVDKFRYSNIQALIGIKLLNELDERTSLRKEKVNRIIKTLKSGINNQRILPSAKSSNYFFIVKIKQHVDKIRKLLLDKGIDISVRNEITDDCSQIIPSNCPVTKNTYNHTIQIPLYDELENKHLKHIGESINLLS